jgi:hypothetical protein
VSCVAVGLAAPGDSVTLTCPSNSTNVDWKYWTPLEQKYVYTQHKLQNGFETAGRHKYYRMNSFVILGITNVLCTDSGIYICEDDDKGIQYYMGLRVVEEGREDRGLLANFAKMAA